MKTGILDTNTLMRGDMQIEAPLSPLCASTAARQNLRGMFCLMAVLRSDRKEVHHAQIPSLTPQQDFGELSRVAAGNALAIAVQAVSQ